MPGMKATLSIALLWTFLYASPAFAAISLLCQIDFDYKPTERAYVSGATKACLDEVTLFMQQQPNSRLVLVGEIDPKEPGGTHLAAQRAVNTKSYLVEEKQIDPSRCEILAGSPGRKMVNAFAVPEGDTLDLPDAKPVREDQFKADPVKVGSCSLFSRLASAKTSTPVTNCPDSLRGR